MTADCDGKLRRAAHAHLQRARGGAITAASIGRPQVSGAVGQGGARTHAPRQAAAQEGFYVHEGPQSRSSGIIQVATMHLRAWHGQAHRSASPPLACAPLETPAYIWSEEMGV